MTNVIKFPEKIEDEDEDEDDLIVYVDFGGDLGISTLDTSAIIRMLNKDQFALITDGTDQLYSRKELAEFLWFAP